MANVRQQINILQNKGMKIENVSEVRKILIRENYYNVVNAHKELFLDSNY